MGADDDSRAGPGGALSPTQERALEEGRELAAPILRAARFSTFTVWTVGLFGVLSVLLGLAGGGAGLLVGGALLVLAWNERRGRDLLHRFDADGATVLGWNQIALAAVVAVYSLAAIRRAWVHPDPALAELETLVGFQPEVVAELSTIVYGAVIVIVALVQAIAARFYFRREAMIEELRRRTPDWVLELVG